VHVSEITNNVSSGTLNPTKPFAMQCKNIVENFDPPRMLHKMIDRLAYHSVYSAPTYRRKQRSILADLVQCAAVLYTGVPKT